MHFFDHNATTPLRPEAKVAWDAAVEAHWLNPSSPYRAAAQVHVRLEAARETFAELLRVETARVVFNSGATEANNAVFAHWAAQLPLDAKIGVSPTEHPSVIEAAKHYFGDRVRWLALDAQGAVALPEVIKQVESKAIAAVSVMAANNETGVINPWQAIAEACQLSSCAYHCDASQWIGKMSTQGLSNCGYVTGCAHKFGGPRGVGFLVLPSTRTDFSGLVGGVQEGAHRAGTEDVASVLAMVAALQAVPVDVSDSARDAFLELLMANLPEVELVGRGASRLWNTVSIIMPEFTSVRWIRALEKRGFLVSAGSACSAGKQGPSHVLAAMGMDAGAMQRVLRISSGWDTTEADWQALLTALLESYAALKADAADSGSQVISI